MFNRDSQLTLHRVVESADDYGESDNNHIPTGGSALESADSELESPNYSTGSNADSLEIDVWGWALSPCQW